MCSPEVAGVGWGGWVGAHCAQPLELGLIEFGVATIVLPESGRPRVGEVVVRQF
jgi:hypothetical protein